MLSGVWSCLFYCTFQIIIISRISSYTLTSCRCTCLFSIGGYFEKYVKADSPSTPETIPQENPYAKADITIQIIPSANNTFGYDILLSKRLLVHQPNIPVLPANEGFTTKKRAQKVAEFVVKKIRNNEMPPTVTMEDLNTLGVLKRDSTQERP